jgi:putative membrane protein
MERLARSIMLLPGIGMVPVVVWAQDRPWDGWGMHPMWGVWGLWGIGMMLAMFVFWGLVIAGIVLGIRWLAAERRPRQSDRALAILRERYARGEINREEFEARRKDLEAA